MVIVVVASITVAMTFVLVARIRDGQRRFLLLGGVVYLMAGLVAITIVNALIGVSLRDMFFEPLPYLLQILVWPVFVAFYLGGSYGR